ncbi:type IV pilus biogenesis/stability protein PilW [Candidatus Fukatsuia symbiotica]|uniref:Type IV pilus biogenesis/stability protein PilW n=2 Tax=Candidatus Fukatsuia TaxID=1927833 RepID=A0A2U8I6I3_9GAMM|nr:type IV pilus biogenesis/stability protein PilW [Candidatus Fukatsuia symbiotica]AWK14791.1 type IV pilus biogenesis/stability protein PilW [Candidatus Fukatsuia symbiotica]MEA9445125.1 type IV pilus biogenesis/stability protein PilW [Candidatus Fukatsuia symbiotica]
MKLNRLWAIYLTSSILAGCSVSQDKTRQVVAGQTRLQLGLEYLLQGDFNAARQNIAKVLHADPQNYQAQLAMALYEQRVGENRAAELRYQKAMKLAPAKGVVLNNYGAFLCGLGQYVSAQQKFSASAAFPDEGQVANSLENSGYCFLQANQNAQARMRLSRALQYDPGKGKQLLVEAERHLALRNSAKVQLLLEVYQNILPANAESLWLQIRFAALAGRQDSVRRYGQQLARNFPQSKQYQHFLAHEY